MSLKRVARKSIRFYTKNYDFFLPKDLIASKPVYPADEAKLLIFDRKTKKTTHDTFKNIINYLPQNLSVYLNNTKVIKARIYGFKPTKGKIELLVLRYLDDIKCLVYIKGKVQKDMELLFEDNLIAKVIDILDDGSKIVHFYQNNQKIKFDNLVTILDKIGHVPLPSYIKRDDDIEDIKDYQTIFAKTYGAVASPTASLHFTQELFNRFKEKFDINYLTLHIGAGTFKPVDVEDIREFKIHKECYDIPKTTIESLQNKTTKKMAIGTTVTRTIEYYNKTKLSSGLCDLFLHPHNKPQITDILLTNFHLPRSTLIMLVASFVGVEQTIKLYDEAIKKDYRFYSYGDAMLVV
ncbi:MAG: tRNA preQ1(34) S-adenosylmethionine ribosyltransferase-isomerase QueA [Campylobacteraceae bacterium 4484_166]|nr:MAG: tRNA preQ1(34) S-adenosylmethionine ribosyltransferase-isomerase QueA [Campylobacteraceae bacterium 4484_166]